MNLDEDQLAKLAAIDAATREASPRSVAVLRAPDGSWGVGLVEILDGRIMGEPGELAIGKDDPTLAADAMIAQLGQARDIVRYRLVAALTKIDERVKVIEAATAVTAADLAESVKPPPAPPPLTDALTAPFVRTANDKLDTDATDKP